MHTITQMAKKHDKEWKTKMKLCGDEMSGKKKNLTLNTALHFDVKLMNHEV